MKGHTTMTDNQSNTTPDFSALDLGLMNLTGLFDENSNILKGDYEKKLSDSENTEEPISALRKRHSSKDLKRRVSFADSFGQELEHILVMTEGRDTPPRLTQCLLFDGIDISNQQDKILFNVDFQQPITNYSLFMLTLKICCVALESANVVSNLLSGSIRVTNIAYEKRVFIHFTTDSWKTVHDFPCHYLNPLGGHQTRSVYDMFGFQLEIPKDTQEMEFCVGYACSGHTYWDNNHGANYKIMSEKF